MKYLPFWQLAICHLDMESTPAFLPENQVKPFKTRKIVTRLQSQRNVLSLISNSNDFYYDDCELKLQRDILHFHRELADFSPYPVEWVEKHAVT